MVEKVRVIQNPGLLHAHNGTDSALPISIGAALLLAGFGLLIMRRRARTMTV